ncbi:MAG: DUF4388 domain-containing protein [Thermoanaerobaculales bacterium]|jgi:hypothetical protein|nr:DUF4388 domain-containing protein [Thermoanaerobaculales bacterium]
MSFEGNLETMTAADLLQWAANGHQTGTIRVTRADLTKRIFIRDGVIVSCTSTDPREFLGHFLVSHGIIDERNLQIGMIDQERTGDLLGQVLVERGFITPEQLKDTLRLKAEEAIFDLFTWNEGEFHFVEDELPSFELVPISLGVQGLVLEGMRRLDEWQRILEVIPSELCVPVAVAPLVGDGDEVDAGYRKVLEAVNDDRSVEDICLHTHSNEFFVCEILFREHRRGRLKIVRPRVVASRAEAAEGATGSMLLGQAREHLEAGRLERCVRCFQAAVSLEPGNRDLVSEVAGVEAEVRRRLVADGLTGDAVPMLEMDPADLASLDLEPSEGFILSRVDGGTPVKAIVKISPLPEIDALLVIWKLVRGEQLRMK